MRLIFMGTPDFSVPALKSLHEAGHEIAAVYTQPPRPAGRGHKIKKSPVHLAAEALHIPVFTPERFQKDDIQVLQSSQADIAVVVAYGLILPRAVLNVFPHGCLNIHASLLPRWRGAAPIQRCIEAGDSKSGITIMQMEEGLDTGPMLLKKEVSLAPSTTGGQLHDELSILGAPLIVKALEKLEAGALKPEIQDSKHATYASKLSSKEGQIIWSQSSEKIEQRLRAFTPWPGNWCLFEEERLKVIKAHVTQGPPVDSTTKTAPGQVVSTRPFTVACGEGFLTLERLQKPGKKPMEAGDFINGHPISVGTLLSYSVFNLLS
ncbi:MAG: methionyl-tRNA formyltransferase [bacterium]|nr:methionyl-tRNA formyltransferase [bacterium]